MGHPLGDGADNDGTGDGQNPAWTPLLNDIPEEFHEAAMPHLKTWDQNYTQGIQKVQAQYKPWENVIQTAGDPEQAAFALNLMRAVQDDPEMIYKALKERYKFDEKAPEEDAKGLQGSQVGELDPAIAARLAQLEQGQSTVAQIIKAQHDAEIEKANNQQLDSELAEAKAKFGDFDERFVLALAANNVPVMDAAAEYANLKQQIASQYIPKPLIMGGGGGMASANNFNVKKASESDLNNYVTQFLAANKAAQQ
jgi:hypothetical protein